MIICGVKECFENLKLTLEAIELDQAVEQTKLHAKRLAADIESKVDNANTKEKSHVRSRAARQMSTQIISNCKFCTGIHRHGNCHTYVWQGT